MDAATAPFPVDSSSCRSGRLTPPRLIKRADASHAFARTYSPPMPSELPPPRRKPVSRKLSWDASP